MNVHAISNDVSGFCQFEWIGCGQRSFSRNVAISLQRTSDIRLRPR